MSTLAQYQTHLDKFGPECVLETAATELSEKELGQLKALIDSRQRIQVFKRGRWGDRKERQPRKCRICGLDLPRDAYSNRIQHEHCRRTAYRRRRGP